MTMPDPSPTRTVLEQASKAMGFAINQLRAMVCAEHDGHAVYPDQDEPADRLETAKAQIDALLAQEGEGT